jgi:hypothetical protein
MKNCSKCGNEYSDNFFEKNRKQCKNCMRETRKLLMRNYRSTLTEIDRSVVADKQAEWYSINKEKVRTTQNKYQRERKVNDLTFKMRSNISTLISRVLKRQGSSKIGDSFLQHLSYSLDDLIKHLESQFESWMNWDNYGKYDPSIWNDNDPSTWTWQLDHIVPQSDLPYTSMSDDNFKKCWSLENLRPLSAKQNWLDGFSGSRHNK